ncbi:MAG: hypothetical protein OXM02_11530 [Bacteroidota bacterium]|nr:hypothetical protein [Bacteroidota bacterium]
MLTSVLSCQKLCRWAWVLVILSLGAESRLASAQPVVLQAGAGIWPGAGLQAGYVRWGSVHSLEIVFYTSSSPWRNEIPLFVSAGFGGTLRPIGILQEIGRADYGYDLDLGVRVGPSLFFKQNASRADKNRQFSLFIDPFVRYSYQIFTADRFFTELGAQRPRLRLGLIHKL